MPNSLEQKFKGRENEVLEAVRIHKVGGAMSLYGVKTRTTFIWWLKTHSNGSSLYPNPLAGFTGGEKAKWLREHRSTILDCLDMFGEDFTMEHFCLKEDTLHQLKSAGKKPFGQRLSVTDQPELKADIAQLGHRIDLLEVRLETHQARQEEIIKRQKHLEKLFHQFVDSTSEQISKAFIAPLLEHLIQFNGNLPECLDPLDIDRLHVDGKKSQLEYGTIKSIPQNPLLETIVRIKALAKREG